MTIIVASSLQNVFQIQNTSVVPPSWVIPPEQRASSVPTIRPDYQIYFDYQTDCSYVQTNDFLLVRKCNRNSFKWENQTRPVNIAEVNFEKGKSVQKGVGGDYRVHGSTSQ